MPAAIADSESDMERASLNNRCAETLPERLKRQNAEVHRHLETAIAILRPDLSMGSYTMLLMKFHGFVSRWEHAVREAIDGDAGLEALFATRFKTAWLEQDLQRLGAPIGKAAASPAVPVLPDLSTTARLLGSAYVMEGSSLGARFVAAHVRQCLGDDEAVPCRYFSGYGERTGSTWQQFLGAMCRLVPQHRHDEAVEASTETFRCLHAWFSEKTMMPDGEMHNA